MAQSIVVMGVSGAGKSTVAAALAAQLGLPMLDADDLHSPTAVAKMRAGEPLTDDDRMPWLTRCAEALAEAPTGAILACSALARRYRDVFTQTLDDVHFVALDLSREEALTRVASRTDHFMPAALIDSQFATLEPLGPAETGIRVNAAQPISAIVDEVAARLTR